MRERASSTGIDLVVLDRLARGHQFVAGRQDAYDRRAGHGDVGQPGRSDDREPDQHPSVVRRLAEHQP